MRPLIPWLLLTLAACPPPNPPAPALRCLTDEELFGAFAGNVVIVDVPAAMARIDRSRKAHDPSLPAVTAGNCDAKLGVDVMRPEDVVAHFPPAEAERARATLLRDRVMDLPVAVRPSARPSAPASEGSAERRDALRTLVGLDAAGATGKGAIVAVVDAGASLAHPALAGRLDADQLCQVDGGCKKGPAPHHACRGAECAACEHPNECTHGTAMATAIGGAAAEGFVGLSYAPDATLKLARVLAQGPRDGGGSAVPVGDTARIARVAGWLSRETRPEEVPVVYFGFAMDPASSAKACAETGPLRKAVERLAKDRIVVAPAGNDGVAEVSAPACFDGVIAVAASGRAQDAAHADTPTVAAAWSNGGTAADLLAPGEDVPVGMSLDVGDGTKTDTSWSSGTSVAAAQVAGAMALAVERKGAAGMLAKSEAERVACVADTSASPARLDLSRLAACP